MIPCSKQVFFLLIPDSKGKHAIEMINTFFFPVIISGNNYFGIRLRLKRIAFLFQLFLEFNIIINFSIVNDGIAGYITPSIYGEGRGEVHWLVTCISKINYRQAAMTKGNSIV